MTEPVDSPRQQLREALDEAVTDSLAPWVGGSTDSEKWADMRDDVTAAVLDALVEAGWGPTAAHEDCVDRAAATAVILRIEDGWWCDTKVGDDDGPLFWFNGTDTPEPMTPQEQEVMSRGA